MHPILQPSNDFYLFNTAGPDLRVREVAMETTYITNSGLGNGVTNKQTELRMHNVCIYVHICFNQSIKYCKYMYGLCLLMLAPLLPPPHTHMISCFNHEWARDEPLITPNWKHVSQLSIMCKLLRYTITALYYIEAIYIVLL